MAAANKLKAFINDTGVLLMLTDAAAQLDAPIADTASITPAEPVPNALFPRAFPTTPYVFALFNFLSLHFPTGLHPPRLASFLMPRSLHLL